jgi:hypothetical protein
MTVNAVPHISEIFGDNWRMVAAMTNLAKIPKAKHEAFYHGINELCEVLDEFSYYPKNTDAKVIAAAQAVRTASNAVLALDPSQLKQLVEAAWFARPALLTTLVVSDALPPEMREGEDWLKNLLPEMMKCADAAFGELIGRSANYQPSGKRGRSKGAVAKPDLRLVVSTLRKLVQENGGELTLGNDNSFATGGIVQALRLLAPHLPKGLVPKGRIKHSFLKPPKI